MDNITLYHKHYDEKHLEKVKAEMINLGAPEIRCIWSEMHGEWMAIEGCHRLRAAHALGLIPTVIEIDPETTPTITIQVDGYDEEVDTIELLIEMHDHPVQISLEFEEEDD